jgi:regulator of nonsense transcripts 1
VCDYSKPYSFGHLNKQYIMILSSLGVRDDYFLEKQRKHFEILEHFFENPQDQVNLLMKYNKVKEAKR